MGAHLYRFCWNCMTDIKFPWFFLWVFFFLGGEGQVRGVGGVTYIFVGDRHRLHCYSFVLVLAFGIMESWNGFNPSSSTTVPTVNESLSLALLLAVCTV